MLFPLAVLFPKHFFGQLFFQCDLLYNREVVSCNLSGKIQMSITKKKKNSCLLTKRTLQVLLGSPDGFLRIELERNTDKYPPLGLSQGLVFDK